MKKLFLISMIWLSSVSIARGYSFPNVEYSFAKIFLFNVAAESATERPEFSVFRKDVYAASKLGEGWDFTNEMNLKMNAIFRNGVEMMVAGLSGCYTPRHGIIYFDELGNPVASISICFECQRLFFWSTQKLPEFAEPKSSNKAIEKAQKQFADLEKLLLQFDIPVFKNNPDYISHIRESDVLYSVSGEIIFDFTNTAAFGNKSYTPNDVKSWIQDANFKFKESTEIVFSSRDYDTTSWKSKIFTTHAGTKISFTRNDEEGVLNMASIKDPEIKMPNGISVGMSLSQIQASFLVWDGLAYPASIVVHYSNMNITYTFENRTLRRIDLVMI